MPRFEGFRLVSASHVMMRGNAAMVSARRTAFIDHGDHPLHLPSHTKTYPWLCHARTGQMQGSSKHCLATILSYDEKPFVAYREHRDSSYQLQKLGTAMVFFAVLDCFSHRMCIDSLASYALLEQMCCFP